VIDKATLEEDDMNARKYGLAVEPFTFQGYTNHYVVDRRPRSEKKFYGKKGWVDFHEAMPFLEEREARKLAFQLYQQGYRIGNLGVKVMQLYTGPKCEIICESEVYLFLTGIFWEPFYHGYERAESRWSSDEAKALRFDSLDDIGGSLYSVIERFRLSEQQ
jgi:hypothetical protein